MSRVLVFGGGLLMVLALVAWLLAPMAAEVAEGVEAVKFSVEYAAAQEAALALEAERQALLDSDIAYLCEQHAVERHGPLSVTIRNACEADPAVKLQRELDGRIALGCMYDNGEWGVSIYEADGDYVTSFPNKAKTLEKLLQYLANREYLQ